MHEVDLLLQKTLISELMSKSVHVVHESDEFHEVQEKMEFHDIRHLPVVNDAGVLVGIITQRDLYKIHSPRKTEDGWYYDKDLLDNFILRNLMRKEVFTLTPQHSLEECIKIMAKLKYGCVVVIDQGRKPCGIVTPHDILKFLLTK
jgi:acetoin utilization protein AcuB